MTKLAIQGLLAITSALWLPAQADSARLPTTGDAVTEAGQANDDAPGQGPALIARLAEQKRER